MSSAQFLVGDVFARLADIPDASVDLVACSPPFWRQRAYLPADHPMKPFEIGQEATPGEFIDVLLRLTAEWRRVLAPHGSIAIELGDTMAGSGGAGGDYNEGGFREGQPKWPGSGANRTERYNDPANPGAAIPAREPGTRAAGRVEGLLAKSHCMIPEAYRLALAYGLNPLTGEPSPAGRWIVRNRVIWARPNPTPGDDGDKFRRASSDIAIATLNPKRYWDGEAVREPASPNTNARTAKGVARRANDGKVAPDSNRDTLAIQHSGDGTRPLYDWWGLASDPYPGSHYAVWNPEIARRLILAMCPQKVCTTCGEPRRRIVEADYTPLGDITKQHTEQKASADYPGQQRQQNAQGMTNGRALREARTVGWTDCGHDSWRRGHVLDPFMGSGTTAAVATGLGRDCTGIDFDQRNVDLARERCGLFLEIPDACTKETT